jgi:hypothetical protein
VHGDPKGIVMRTTSNSIGDLNPTPKKRGAKRPTQERQSEASPYSPTSLRSTHSGVLARFREDAEAGAHRCPSGLFLTVTKKGKLSLRVTRDPKIASQTEIEELARANGLPIADVYILAKSKLSIIKETPKGKKK